MLLRAAPASMRTLPRTRPCGDRVGRGGRVVEPPFFGNLVLVLECCFVHRARGIEGKEGQSAERGADVSNALLLNNGVLAADKTIKYKRETSVLKLKVGGQD
jgi:hypothetical protein